MYLLYIYFNFKSTKIESTFTDIQEYQTHDIEYSACILHMDKNNLHHFSIFYNISIFSLCASKCVA